VRGCGSPGGAEDGECSSDDTAVAETGSQHAPASNAGTDRAL
jgi:hypothetical protein